MTSTPKWEENLPRWVYQLSKKRFTQLGRIILELLSQTHDETVRATRDEILATFDEMVTLRPKEAERSDIVTFRDWLHRQT